MKEIIALSANLSPVNIVLLLLGVVAYFVMEYKLKSGDKTFSVGFWIKDNWYNVVFSLACTAAYFIIQENVTRLEAFTLGLAPNLIADWAGNMIGQMKKKTSGQ